MLLSVESRKKTTFAAHIRGRTEASTTSSTQRPISKPPLELVDNKRWESEVRTLRPAILNKDGC